ncbi:MAG: DsbA family protein [Anaerolineales bacterium]|nr:DsbA family protein [Anaerolineales bacterium]MBX3036683.1 DsbA family protein [Anaerolineales bacterium]
MPTKTKKSEYVIEEEPVVQDPENTITFNRNTFFSILVVLAFAVGVLTGFFLWGYNQPAENANQPSGQVAAAPTQQPQYVRYEIATEGYPSLGPDDAPITIVEFSDFQCPFCKRFHEETYQALLDAYPGQIRFVYRNLPLTSIHPDAMPAAVASLCANEQNVYWEYHDKLFSSTTLGTDTYIQYANELNLNIDEFTACLNSGKFDAFIQQDMDFAFNLGVSSTPTFFINGLAIVGAQPLSSFQNIIDKELAGEIP